MKKKNSFASPTRQSPVAIIMLIWKFYKRIISQAWYILIPIFFGGENIKEHQVFYIVLVLGLIAIISLVFAVLDYYRFHFFISNNELHIQRGVIKKVKLNIPFDRVQTINFEQNIIHQLFDVIRLDVDTAGSKGNEFSFDALDKTTANDLRDVILVAKKQIQNQSDLFDENVVQNESINSPILKLGLNQLIKIGLSQNHFRSALLFIVFVFWIYQQLQDIGFNVEDRLENVQWEGLHPNVFIIGILILLYFALIIVISIVRTILLYFNLQFSRIQNGFKVESGLLNRKQFSALDRKIQMVKWSDNPLKRMLGIFDLQLKQASSVEVVSKKSLRIPGCSMENIENVHQFLYPTINLKDTKPLKVDFSYFWRNVLYTGIIPTVIVFSIFFYFNLYTYAYWSILILLYSVITTYVAYKKWSIFIHPEMMRTKQGVFGNKYEEVALFKIQNITVNQNLFQQRRSLANLILYTASGSMRIPYIPISRANEFRDYILYIIEKDERKWM